MLYSDDEDELSPPRDVTDYKFVNGDDEPVSLAELPVQLNELHGKPSHERVYLRGKTDKGVRSVYTEIIAWKIDLSCKNNSVLSVLSVDGDWIKLLKPIRAFEVIIRTVLVTVEFLHIIKWDCKISSNKLWDCLCKRLRMFESSEEDLVEHVSLIRDFIEVDKTLAESQIILTFLKEKHKKRMYIRKESTPFKPSLIADGVHYNDDNVDESAKVDEIDFLVVDNVYDNDYPKCQNANADHSDDEDDDDDYVCAICDNGGAITQCEGKCMRSFHLTKEVDDDDCYSLGFTKEQAEQIKDIAFYCKNCEYKQHQCFCCGKLESSDESSFGCVKVFRCINGTCGRFYHPDCVAKLLHPNDELAAKKQCQRISSGEYFTCPAHKCYVCKELELKSDKELQFAVCRRCPRAYHRKCLPRNIAFESDVNAGKATVQRAWDDVIPNRILIYCLEHDIDDDLLTPVRNHIKFPCQTESLEGISYLLQNTSSKRVESAHEISERHNLDDDARKRILSLVKDASTSIMLEEIKESREGANSSKFDVDSITLGKVEVSVQAIRAAFEILDKGGSVQDAKAVCGNDLLLRRAKWRKELRAYLAPFLCETRYTSLGPHFIATYKLQEIVNMLHCYIQDGDMMVDICRGSEDFSFLLKNKLDELGKTCSFKNFDIVQAKYDFCFERRDWMTVEPHELPDGSRLIMILNPPLGVNVALVNKFINKALTFKPKLLTLIVPRETQRLDEKEFPYNLIWKDDEMLAGKGSSGDEHDKPIDDRNMESRILYLWSNPDWTQKHNAVAERHGHGSRKNYIVEGNLINQFEEGKPVGETNGSPSNNRSEGNLLDSGNNKRKLDMDKKASAEMPPTKRPAFRGEDRSEYNSSPRIDCKGISRNFLSKTSERRSPGERRNKDSPRNTPKPDCNNRATTKRCTGYPFEARKNRSEVDEKVAQEKSPTNCPVLIPTLSKLGLSKAHSSKHLDRQSSKIHFWRDRSDSCNSSQRKGDKGLSGSRNLKRRSFCRNNNDSYTRVPRQDSGRRASTEWCTGDGYRKRKREEAYMKAAAAAKPLTKRPAFSPPSLKLGPSKASASRHFERKPPYVNFENYSSKNHERGTLVQKKNINSPAHFPKHDCGNRASTERCISYHSEGESKDSWKNKRKIEVDTQATAEKSSELVPSVVHSPKHLDRQSSHDHSRKDSSYTVNVSPRMGDKGVSENCASGRQSFVQKNADSPTHVTKLDSGYKTSTVYPENNKSSMTQSLAATPAMQKHTPCLDNADNVQKTMLSPQPPMIDTYNQPVSTMTVGNVGDFLGFTPEPYRPPPGTCGWLDE